MFCRRNKSRRSFLDNKNGIDWFRVRAQHELVLANLPVGRGGRRTIIVVRRAFHELVATDWLELFLDSRPGHVVWPFALVHHHLLVDGAFV
jgi:hypothetical protein